MCVLTLGYQLTEALEPGLSTLLELRALVKEQVLNEEVKPPPVPTLANAAG